MKPLPLRLRLTVVTSLLLVLICGVFAAFSVFNAEYSISAALVATPIVEAVPFPAGAPTEAAMATTPSELTAFHTKQFSVTSLWFMLGIVVVGSGVMYVAAGYILRPLKKLSQQIAAVDSQGLDTRIEDYQAGDELTALSGSFNELLVRLYGAFARERRFSAAAAHELKTPLAVMKTNIEVLDETATQAECFRCLTIAKKQADRMVALVNQLSGLAALGKTSLASTVDLAEVVVDAAREYGGEGIKLTLEAARVRGDGVLLQQAVANLLSNACKYGSEAIDLSLTTRGKQAEISVRDFGKGVPEAEQQKIFEPFYRIESSRARALGGSGLGLALVAEIAALHGGSVSCHAPKEGSGTVFVLRLPSDF